MRTIEMFLEGCEWKQAHLMDGEPDPQTVEEEGTHILFAPFTDIVSAGEVQRLTQQWYPEFTVIVKGVDDETSI